MKAIVLFDSMQGNTEKIANSLTKGLRDGGIQAECVNIKGLSLDKLPDYDLIAVGAPTQWLSASKPMKEFLSRLDGKALQGKYGFAFDTRNDRFTSGSAAKYIEKQLQELGLKLVLRRSSAFVEGQPYQSVLKEGMEGVFEATGKQIADILVGKTTAPKAT